MTMQCQEVSSEYNTIKDNIQYQNLTQIITDRMKVAIITDTHYGARKGSNIFMITLRCFIVMYFFRP